jgi:hypothetical protein
MGFDLVEQVVGGEPQLERSLDDVVVRAARTLAAREQLLNPGDGPPAARAGTG